MDSSLPDFDIQHPNHNLAFFSRLNSLQPRLVLRHGFIVILQNLQDYNEAVWPPMRRRGLGEHAAAKEDVAGSPS